MKSAKVAFFLTNSSPALMVTLEPENDKDPKPAWSQSVAVYRLIPPFGQ